MTAFQSMIDDLYADSDLARDGRFYAKSGTPPFDVRVMKREPEAALGGQLGAAIVAGLALAVRQSQVPTKPVRGDALSRIETASGVETIYDIEAATADGERLEWFLTVTRRADPTP